MQSPDAESVAGERPYSRYLTPPFLPRGAAATAQRLATGHLPVLLAGEQGTGRRRVARALHQAACPTDPFVVVRGPGGQADLQAPLAALSPDVRRVTVYVENIEELDHTGQECLLMMLDEGVGRRGSEKLAAWFILASSADLRGLAERGQFLPELCHRVSTLVLTLPPLRARQEDIPELVQCLSDEVAAFLPLARVRYTERAIDELRSYAWPGNIHELEAVVRRTLVMQRKETIDAEDLLFDPTGQVAGAGAAARQRLDSRPAPLPHELEYLLIELAHELKNPMVTIKTFAQHLDDLLGDAEARTRFRVLAEEAIGRMDGLLENLLEFSRLPAPEPAVIEVAPLVHEALDRVKGDLAAKQVDLRLAIANGRAWTDARHLRYALSNLVREVAAEVPARSWLAVELDSRGSLRFALPPSRGLTQRLKDLMRGEHARGRAGAVPLGFVLARSVVAANGGRLRVGTPAEGWMDVTVTLPAAE